MNNVVIEEAKKVRKISERALKSGWSGCISLKADRKKQRLKLQHSISANVCWNVAIFI